MRRIFLALSVGGFAAAGLVPAAAIFADKKLGRDVTLIVPHDPGVVEMNRMLWEKGQPVAEIYGNASSVKVRVVRPDPRDLVVPEEDPSMSLLKTTGERRPLQVQTVYFFARFGTAAGFLCGVFALLGWLLMSKKLSGAAVAP